MTICVLEGPEDNFPSQMREALSHSVDCERLVTLYLSFNDTSNEQGGIPDFDIKVEQLPRGQVKITVTEVQEPHWQEKRELEHHSSTSKTVLDVTLQHPCPAERVTDYMQKVDHDEFEERARRYKEERETHDN
mgnify:FL=1|jgi:hypothetical protein